MRKLLPAVLTSLAFISYGALAADNPGSDPVKPELGAGPHLDRSAQESGTGSSKDKTPPAVPPVRPSSPDDAAGSSAGPSRAPDTVQDQEDERKASEAKEKMKKKPGYQEEAPSPRASHTGMTFN